MANLERFKNDRKLLLAHRDWLEGYRQNHSNYPVTLEIDPTNDCPLHCGHCVWDGYLSSSDASLNADVLNKTVREAAELGVKSLIWTGGGEPLINRATLGAIKLSTELGMKNGMFTTAAPMNRKASDVLLDNLSWIRFHLDSANRHTYTAVHGVKEPVFDQVINNIRYFSAKRSEKKVAVSAGIGTIALDANIQEAVDLAKLSKKLGLDYFQYKHDLNQMCDPRYLQWWNSVVIPLMDRISKELEGDGFTIQYSKGVDYAEKDNTPTCHVHHAITSITADGRIAYCKSLRDRKDWFLGNVKESPLRDIFDSSTHRELIGEITPATCGIIPCPNKQANITIEHVLQQGIDSLLNGEEQAGIEHPEFI